MHTELNSRVRETFLPFALPSIGQEEIDEVVDTLASGWVTTGPKVKIFERDFAQYVGAKHAIACNSCTAALHISLAALGISPGDEVILPTMTFCSTANVVVHLGARPVLADIDEDFGISVDSVRSLLTPKTRAIVPVHYAGQPCNLAEIHRVASESGLLVVEDGAHAVGTSYNGIKIGADLLRASGVRGSTAFSFYATKNMTTGEGGMIATSNDELAEKMRILTLHGMSRDAWKRYGSTGSWYYEVTHAGYKQNMTDIQAALGIHQLRKLDHFIEVRKKYAAMYDEAFAPLEEILCPLRVPDRDHVFHLYVIRLNLSSLSIDRAAFIQELRSRQIGTSVHFIPVHLHPFYRENYGYQRGDLPNAERIYDSIISLPLYPKMTETDVGDVIAAVRWVIAKYAA